ncbi:MAG: hypothetical protein CK522_02520 [Opitutia bacterium]|nr:MAG: hypothetical protein CK522_02520 [Opitutae bacterium]
MELVLSLSLGDAPELSDLLGGNIFRINWEHLGESTIEVLPMLLYVAFALLQSCVFFLPLAPSLTLSAQPTALWPRLLGAAFCSAFLVALPLFALLDVYYFLPGANPKEFESGAFIIGILVAWLVSWIVWTAILLRRVRTDESTLESSLLRTSKASLVGLTLCLPWYLVLRRKQSCACSLGTFVALVTGLWSLLVIGGPLLLVLARDRRLRGAVKGD